MQFDKILVDYLEYLEIEQNRSQKTIANYHHYLLRLSDYAGEIKVEDITTDLIRKWRIWLNRIGTFDSDELAKSTTNYHLIALRNFLKYCAKRDIKALSPEKIELARVKRKQVTFLSSDELSRLFESPDVSSKAGLRDRAILELLYSSGLRISELTNINVDHINLKRKEFMVRGKGQNDRPVFISDEASKWIEKYLEERISKAPALFLQIGGAKKPDLHGNYLRLTPRSIQRMISKYAKLAGITKKVTPHTLRHSYATNLLMNGADIRSVQAMLGHSNISTTQIYTHITDSHLKDIHKKFHGRDKI